MSFDPDCYILAMDFLLDSTPSVNTQANCVVLAQVIQDAIELQISSWEMEAEIDARASASGGAA